MSDRAAYSRVYWSVLDDAKFEAIRCDMRHFGSWALLLVVADMAYPAPAFIPPTIPRRSLAALVDAGLVDLLTAGMYRIHGLASERERRAAAATRLHPERTPTAPRTGPKRDPDGPLRALDEDETRTRRDETSTTRASGMEPIADVLPRAIQEPIGISEDEGRVFAFIARFGAAVRPDAPLGRRLLGLIERRGVEEVLVRAGELAKAGPMSDRQWVLGLENVLDKIPDAKDARAVDVAEEARKRSERVQADMQRRRLEQYRYTGKWDEAWGPMPEGSAA